MKTVPVLLAFSHSAETEEKSEKNPKPLDFVCLLEKNNNSVACYFG